MNQLPSPTGSINNNEVLEGWIFGKWYLGYIQTTKGSHDETKKELYIVTSIRWFQNVTYSPDEDETEEDSSVVRTPILIHLWEREGTYFYLCYSRRCIDISRWDPTPEQVEITHHILSYYEEHRNSVVLLHGQLGTGKSMIPLLLAQRIIQTNPNHSVHFCDTFKPTDPGDSFNNLYNRVNPTSTSPLIVVLEEYDRMVDQIHHQKIMPHKHIPISIPDKPGWNQFLDRFDRRYYPWVIIVLTSNLAPDVINAWDPSYIRPGRVNQIFEVVETKGKEK